MNNEQKDFQNAIRTLPTSLDTPGNENCVQGEPSFIDEKQLLARLPVSRRTLGNWRAKGILPFIKIGRRCLYDWTSVQGALLRRQRGGQS